MMSVSETIFKEAEILLKAFTTGVVLMLVYDILRIMRRLISHGTIAIAIEDFLFWLGSAITIFSMLFRENDGYLRAFSIGGVIVGMLLYTKLLSGVVIRGSVCVLEKVLYVIARPFVWSGRLLRKPMGVCGGHIKKIGRYLKKRLKKILKAVKISLCKL